MHWAKEISVDATDLIISVANAKEHLRVDTSDDDTLITFYIDAARTYIEEYLGRTLVPKTLKLHLDRFPYDGQSILIPDSPVVAISSITYVDTNGDTQTWASSEYNVDIVSLPSRLETAYNVSYPSTRAQHNAVTITYTAGYDVTAGISLAPGAIGHAIKLMLGSMYEVRENDCPAQLYSPSLGFKTLLAPYKLYYRGPWA